MRMLRFSALVLALVGLTASCNGSDVAPLDDKKDATQTDSSKHVILTFVGNAEASAVVFVNDSLFVIADDEDNILRLYSVATPGRAVGVVDLSDFLSMKKKKKEADLEGVARIDNRLYWIASHGRDKKGEWEQSRHRFFATDLVEGALVPTGIPYIKLADDLVADERYGSLVAESIGLGEKEDGRLAPKESGFNIEGLSVGGDGKSLLIGLRNPRPGGKGLLIPLLNPEELVEGVGPAKFGDPIRLDLGGLGIRSIEWIGALKSYVIVAGGPGGGTPFRLYKWSGLVGEEPVSVMELTGIAKDFAPEGVAETPGSTDLLLISDDGDFAGDVLQFRAVKIGLP